MDNNLTSGKYDEGEDAAGDAAFADDVRLIFTNCRTYNHEDSEISKTAATLLAYFEKMLCVYNRYTEAASFSCRLRYFCEDDDTIASLCSKFRIADTELVLAMNRLDVPRCVPENELLELETPLIEATFVWLPGAVVAKYDGVGSAEGERPVLAESKVVYIAEEDDTPRDLATSLGIMTSSLLILNKPLLKGLSQNSKLVRGTALVLPKRRSELSKVESRRWETACNADGMRLTRLFAATKKSLNTMLEDLRASGDTAPFEPPIDDTVAPGYSNVIAVPMALQIIEENISLGTYTADLAAGSLKFAAHVRLVFRNCMQYNAAGSGAFSSPALLLRFACGPICDSNSPHSLSLSLPLPPPLCLCLLLTDIWLIAEYLLQEFSRIWRSHCTGVKRKSFPSPFGYAAAVPRGPTVRVTHKAANAKSKSRARAKPKAKAKPRSRKRAAPARRRASPAKRSDDQTKRCLNLLDYLMEEEDAIYLNEPVDVKYFPSYLDVIDEPMDLGTIRKKLKKGGFSGPRGSVDLDALVTDLRLVWANCKKFNVPQSEVRWEGLPPRPPPSLLSLSLSLGTYVSPPLPTPPLSFLFV